jgi:hypothetical protein
MTVSASARRESVEMAARVAAVWRRLVVERSAAMARARSVGVWEGVGVIVGGGGEENAEDAEGRGGGGEGNWKLEISDFRAAVAMVEGLREGEQPPSPSVRLSSEGPPDTSPR